MNIASTTGGATVVEDGTLAPETGTQDSATTETNAQTDGASTETTAPDESGKAPADTSETGKTQRVRPADRLAQLSTVEGWLALLAERVNEAVEQAVKDDSAFEPPVKAEEVEALLAEGLALIVPEVAPKLEALAKACAGARAARLSREAAHRVSCKRSKAAAAKVAKDRDAAAQEAERLRAKLASLEKALGKSGETKSAETPKTEPTS